MLADVLTPMQVALRAGSRQHRVVIHALHLGLVAQRFQRRELTSVLGEARVRRS